MNSQQELLNAINSIAASKNRSYDTPAEVLRVEGDTVWVHIDGGADETPVLKTINCEQGERVQVRIANGNAFLVGNASAPPTDDKRANKAYFIAEQADINAGTAIKSVNAISQTVEGKVDTGDSNIEVLSSTMYQNANGVNVFNGNLALGDSYAHIDGDSFDIKEVTTVGQIDDANDKVVASFGETSKIQQIHYYDVSGHQESSGSRFNFSQNGLNLETFDTGANKSSSAWYTADDMHFSDGSTGISMHIGKKGIYNGLYHSGSWPRTDFALDYDYGSLFVSDEIRTNGNLKVGGSIQDTSGNNLLDGWTATATVSNNTVTFSGLSDSYGYDLCCENKLIGISAISKSGSGSNVTLTYTLTGASNGDVCKLRILR